MLELLASHHGDIGVRAMRPVAVPPRHFYRNSPLPYRLQHLGLGEEAKDRDARIGVEETGGANEQKRLCGRVETSR